MADFSTLRWLAILAVRAGWAPLGVVLLFLWLSAIGRLADFDHLVHGLGGASMAYVALVGLSMRREPSSTLQERALKAFGIASGIALVWEIAEFVADRTLGTTMQHGARETMGDLVSGMVGAASVALLALVLKSVLRRLR